MLFEPRSVRPIMALSMPSKAPGADMNQLPVTKLVPLAAGFSMFMTVRRSRMPDSWAVPIISAMERAAVSAAPILPLTLATARSLKASA